MDSERHGYTESSDDTKRVVREMETVADDLASKFKYD